jgi:hypothetical protein
MTTPAPESYPPAPEELRGQLFLGIFYLALNGIVVHESHLAHYAPKVLEPDWIPDFIRSRLPHTDLPTNFFIRATSADDSEDGGQRSSLLVARTALHPDFSSATDWRIHYLIKDGSRSHQAQRLMYGDEYRLPRPMPREFPGGFDEYLRVVQARRVRQESAVPTVEQSGPWPPKLVVPEGEQLLALIADLQAQTDAGQNG